MKFLLPRSGMVALLLGIAISAKEAGYVYYNLRYTEEWTKFQEIPAGIGPHVTMCWESNAATIVAPNGSTYDFATIRNKTKGIVESQWARYSRIYFRWLTTHSDLQCDVKIHFFDNGLELGAVEDRGGRRSHDLYLDIDWMVPIQESAWKPEKPTPRTWWNSVDLTKRKDTQYGFLEELVLHEFGHILGFSHEHLRTAEGRAEYEYDITRPGDREIGAYDQFSIMNYFRLFKSNTLFPNPKLSCGDVASARVLYGPSTQYPNLAPNCYEKNITEAAIQNMTAQQLTDWVADGGINTTSKTMGENENPPVVHAIPASSYSTAYVENVTVHAVPTSNPPGYTLTFGLKDQHFEGVSCNSPVRISRLKLHTVEKSWNHYTDCAQHDDCAYHAMSEISLSSCNPSATVQVPIAKGTRLGPNLYIYEDCSWKNEGLLGWFGEKITFGVVIRNGDYQCVERNGMYSEVSFAVNGKETGIFELPFNLDRAMAFYPLVMGPEGRAQVRPKLDSGELKQHFWVDQFEVTQGSYYTVTGKLPSTFIGIASRPVERVTWFDAIRYCNLRSVKEGLSPVYTYTGEQYDQSGACIGLSNLQQDIRKNGYRLLTQKEWHQAERAGLHRCPTDDQPNQPYGNYAWYWTNSNNSTHPVGQKKPNPWGLFDMKGNVEEWVWDALDSRRMTLGGGYSGAIDCGGAFGGGVEATARESHIGFRVMRRAVNQEFLQTLLLD